MSNDLNVNCVGIFQVERVEGGTYDNADLHANSSGSIHVLGDLVIKNKLTITADHSATVLLPHKVTCETLSLTSEYSSNVNSNDLEVSGLFEPTVRKSSTASLYLKLKGPTQGKVNNSSTMNTWINWPDGKKTVDVSVDGSSVFSQRDWSG